MGWHDGEPFAAAYPTTLEAAVPMMQFDLVAVAQIWMGGALLMVALLGLVARFALPPLLDAVSRLRGAGAEASQHERLSRHERALEELALAVERLHAEAKPY